MTKDEAIEKVIDAFGFWECEYDTGDVDTAWDLKMKIEALEELIDEWRKEHETD